MISRFLIILLSFTFALAASSFAKSSYEFPTCEFAEDDKFQTCPTFTSVIGEEQGTTKLHHLIDHLGSVTHLIDPSGATRAAYTYTPFGERTKTNGDLDTAIGYTSHHHHPTGLILTQFRAYDAYSHQWLTRDPLESLTGERAEMLPEGSNLYAYVGNSPLIGVDPLGLDMWCSNSGGGHSDVIISDPTAKHGLRWFSFAPGHGLGRAGGNWENLGTPGKLDSAEFPKVPPGYLHIPTSKEQDARALAKAQAIQKNPPAYRALSENCADVAQKILEAGLGVPIKGPEPTTPNSLNRALEFMLKNRSLYGF